MDNKLIEKCENCIHFGRVYIKREYRYLKTGYGVCRLKIDDSKSAVKTLDKTCVDFTPVSSENSIEEKAKLVKALSKRLSEITGLLELLYSERPDIT